MTPEEFTHSWIKIAEPLTPLSPVRLNSFNLKLETKEFLIKAGLPTSAAPMLRFTKDTDDIVYGITKLVELYDFEEDWAKFDKYVVIGSCRDGDPIAINTDENDLIEELDHGNGFTPKYFNSSINALAGFLVIYRNFEHSVLTEHGEEGWQNFYFTDAQFDLLKSRMLSIDHKALTEEGFWKDELELIISLRKEYLEK